MVKFESYKLSHSDKRVDLTFLFCLSVAVFFTFRQPLYMFLEGVGSGTVCIDKVNPTVETIRIMISGGKY